MGYELEALIGGLIFGAVVVYFILRTRIAYLAEIRGKEVGNNLFLNQKSQLESAFHQAYKAEFEKWKATELIETVNHATEDALSKARAVLKGKIGEQLAPLLPEFLKYYTPSEARFLGTPIDYVIFKNLSKVETGEPLEIILLDVKTGGATLNSTQKKIKSAVEEGRVKFHPLHVDVCSETESVVENHQSKVSS
jgi:predicted Holliday junction resolvase-like endonuclease